MFKNKLKSIISDGNNDGNNKKKIENLVFLVIILIITVVVINYIWNGNKSSNKTITNSAGRQLASSKTSQDADSNQTYSSSNSESLERRLEDILKNIDGVGDVKVFINYSESSETVAMYNENAKKSMTEETDKSGGVRKVEETDSQKEVICQEQNGNKTPIVQKTIEPKIEGAIITAKGASDINVKTNIIQAVEAATGLATHKIQVFQGN